MNINRGGSGVVSKHSGTGPIQNPEPSTERGKRRHAARNENDAKRASKAWTVDRSQWPRCRPKTGRTAMRDSNSFSMS